METTSENPAHFDPLGEINTRARDEGASYAGDVLLAAMFESLPVGVGLFDTDGALLLANPEMRRFLPTGVIPSRDDSRYGRWRGYDADGRRIERADYPGARALRGERVLPGVEYLYMQDDGREIWTRVSAIPIKDEEGRIRCAMAVVTDIDAQKRTAEALAASEARQAFLLRLSDALRPLSDPVHIQAAVTRTTMAHFGADRCYYCEVEGGDAIIRQDAARADLPSVVGVYPLASLPIFHAVVEAGRPFVVADAYTTELMDESLRQLCIQLQIISFIDVPVVKDERVVGILCLTQCAQRAWTESDVGLTVDTAERTWAAVERARAQKALRESEENLSGVANIVPDLLWSSGPDGSATWYNHRWLAYTGQTLEQAVGWGWVESIHPDDQAASMRRYRIAVEQGKPLQQEHRIRRYDGEYRWFLVRAAPLLAADGSLLRMYGAATDVHEQRMALEALAASEERFRLLVEGTRDYAMFLLDINNRITYWSAGAERVFGWSEAEALGKPGNIIFTHQDRALGEVNRELGTALADGMANDRRWHVRKDGSRLFLDGTLARLDDAAGRVRGFVKVGRDATEQHRAEEALREAHDELELRVLQRTADLQLLSNTRQELLQRLVTIQEDERRRIARELHDSLGQFLSALNFRLSMLQQISSAPPELAEDLQDVRQLAYEIDSELNRLTLELRPPALDDFGLPAAIRRYAAAWTQTANIPVEVYDSGFGEERLSPVSEAAIYRIVQEALTNILKHANASSVNLVMERRRTELRVIVEDNGIGFEPSGVVDVEGARRRLGLIGMQERAILAGGSLEIESTPGEGTTIYAHIPIPSKPTEGTS